MPRKILALDPANSCGFAHSCGISGTWDLRVRRDESAGMRLIRLRSKLKEILNLEGIDLVVYEAARHAAPGMQGALVSQTELQSVIKVWCHDNNLEYRGYSPTEVKKHATGKGNANKALMCELGAKKFGLEPPVDDNQVDALWLLDMAIKEYDV